MSSDKKELGVCGGICVRLSWQSWIALQCICRKLSLVAIAFNWVGCIKGIWSSLSVPTRALGVLVSIALWSKKEWSITSVPWTLAVQLNPITDCHGKKDYESYYADGLRPSTTERCLYICGWCLSNKKQKKSSRRTIYLISALVGLHSSSWRGEKYQSKYLMGLTLTAFVADP